MPYYKNIKNELFFLDNDEDRHYLPIDCVPITSVQADAIINTPEKIKADVNAPVLAAIGALEVQVTPRLWREYITKPNTAVKNGKTPAQFIADIDSQIAVLRGQLI